jgi:ribosomal protein S19E (S16A)
MSDCAALIQPTNSKIKFKNQIQKPNSKTKNKTGKATTKTPAEAGVLGFSFRR